MTAVLLVSVTGYGLVLLFGMSGAPDLALTQALVETIVLVVFVLVLRRLPKQIAQRNPPVHKVARGIIGALAGIVMGVIGLVALGARIQPTIADGLPALAIEAHGKNIVNVMLVDIRAWDTLGEISVLVAVATGVASLIFVSGRTGGARGSATSTTTSAGRTAASACSPVPEPAASIRAPRTSLADTEGESDAAAEAASTRQTWLLAGRTHLAAQPLDPHRGARAPAVPPRDHRLGVPALRRPQRARAAGSPAASSPASRSWRATSPAAGTSSARRRRSTPAACSAPACCSPPARRRPRCSSADVPLESAWFEADVPVLGTISIGTSTLFDIGVYLVVVGLVLDILRSLGGEVDRQEEQAGDEGEDGGDLDAGGADAIEQGEGPRSPSAPSTPTPSSRRRSRAPLARAAEEARA